MDVLNHDTYVENVNGNCVIVTRLSSSTEAAAAAADDDSNDNNSNLPRTPLYIPYSSELKTQSETSFSQQLPPPLPSVTHLEPSICMNDTSVLNFMNYQISQNEKNINLQENNKIRKNSFEKITSCTQALVSLNPNKDLTCCSLKRLNNLGPLLVVRRSRKTSSPNHSTPLSEIEKLSYQREIGNLRDKLKQVEAILNENKENFEKELLKRIQHLEESRREDEHHRRQKFQQTLMNLRVENQELENRIKSAEESTTITIAREIDKVDREWRDRLIEKEAQYKERLRVGQQNWEKSIEIQLKDKREALIQVQELAHTVEELETTLRQVNLEKQWLEHEREAFVAQQQQQQQQQQPHLMPSMINEKEERIDSKMKVSLETEVMQLRRALKESKGYESVLIKQLEACGNEAASHETNLERQLLQVRQELETERSRGADLVKLYGSQVESLHQQLNDAMKRNKELTKQLARFQ